MTTDYMYEDNINTHANTSQSRTDGYKISKGLKRIFIIAGIVLAAELIWLLGITPFIPFSVIDVHGFPGMEKDVVLKFAGIDDTSSFASVNVKEIKDILSKNILVEQVTVIKRFPDKLSIFLLPRQPAAVALTTINDRQSLLYVDRQGIFFKIEEANAQNVNNINIPVISGIENPRINMRLPEALVTLTESLSLISASSPELLSAISEVRIERKPWEGYELVLYPVHSPVKVRVENNLTEDSIRFILLMLNVFDSNTQPIPSEIDFRSGIGSYNIKELSL